MTSKEKALLRTTQLLSFYWIVSATVWAIAFTFFPADFCYMRPGYGSSGHALSHVAMIFRFDLIIPVFILSFIVGGLTMWLSRTMNVLIYNTAIGALLTNFIALVALLLVPFIPVILEDLGIIYFNACDSIYETLFGASVFRALLP